MPPSVPSECYSLSVKKFRTHDVDFGDSFEYAQDLIALTTAGSLSDLDTIWEQLSSSLNQNFSLDIADYPHDDWLALSQLYVD